jgi:hypothetical protein
MVVKGTKNLKHCALLDPSPNPDQVDPWEDDVSAQGGEIKVTFQQGEHDIVQNQDGQYEDPRNRDNNGTSKAKGKRVYKTNRKTKDKAVPQKGVQTAHESMKVNRHRHRPRQNRTMNSTVRTNESTTTLSSILNNNNRSKRNTQDDTETQDYAVYDEEDHHDDGDGNEEEIEEEEEEEDSPPNPVGVEADELDLEDKGRREDDTIDEEDIRSSGSSFAKNLWSCYGGDTLFTQSFSASSRCVSQDNMMKHAIRMRTVHEVTATGYYYYIFYSDNDIVSNDIFARYVYIFF